MENTRPLGSEPQTDARSPGWKTRDVVVAAALAVPLGFVYTGWLLLWAAAQVVPELSHLLGGLYVVAAVLCAYVIRRPGAALLGEMIAALVETPLAGYGAIVLLLGLFQGLGVEAVFLATRYRRFSLPVLMLAGAVGALAVLFGRFYLAFGYASLDPTVQVVRLLATVIGGALLGGLLAKILGDGLAQTGVLNNFPIARDRVREI